MTQGITTEIDHRGEPFSWRTASVRLSIGLAQGVGLYLLWEAQEAPRTWPADHPPLFAALLVVLAFVPLIGLGGVGRIRPMVLSAWVAAAAVILAVFAWHDMSADIWSYYPQSDRLAPAFQVFFFGSALVFIGHHLIGPADAERRLIAPYPAYFDWAWKDAVQIGLSIAFVGVLWASLGLGAQLFKLIGIEAFAKLIAKRWFIFPVTAVAFAAAVQLTDVRIGLIRGVRTVGLVLLSWLLPVMTAIAVGFLAALPFTGLQPLFGTRSATATLLAAMAVLIVLISAAYQDGSERRVPVALRYAARAAGVALAPLVAIAAAALWLRVHQYGLTPERVEAVACTMIAAGYAGGYAFAGLWRRGPWMRALERTNVVMATAVAALLVLFTPIADPARVAVDDQIGRLLSGRVATAAFDYQFLAFHAGRYGRDALQQLKTRRGDPKDDAIATAAVNALKPPSPQDQMVSPTVLEKQFHVYPKGATLPRSFLGQDWSGLPSSGPDGSSPGNWSYCFHDGFDCDAYIVDIDGDHVPEILISAVPSPTSAQITVDLGIFKASSDGAWRNIGSLTVRCQDAIADLRAGHIVVVPATGHAIELAGRRQQMVVNDDTPCPAIPK